MWREKKKILIHSIAFSPDGATLAYLYNDIALAFKAAGYDVAVMTTTPQYGAEPEQLERQPLRWGFWGVYKTSSFHGVPVYHVPQRKFKLTSLRLLGFVYWHIVSFFLGVCIRHVDVILSPSPPLTLGRLNNWLGRLKRCKVVYTVQEIYPDILDLDEKSLVNRYLRGLERRVYKHSDVCTTIDKVFYDTIIERFDDPNKLHIIPNFVDTAVYREGVSTDVLDKRLFPETDSLKLVYAGNVGFAQDWQTLIRLAEKTRGMKVEYFLVGDGMRRSWVEQQKVEHRLDNLHIIDYQPRHLMPAILAYCDLHFVFMTPEAEKMGFPSKVYTIMACARPLLVCSGQNTPMAKFLEPVGCAKIVSSRDVEQRVDEMVQWISEVRREELIMMGKKGKDVIEEKYTKERVTGQYVELIKTL